jgi:hypothetical protein
VSGPLTEEDARAMFPRSFALGQAAERRAVAEALRGWGEGRFGGGLVPFDSAYREALRAGATIAEAQAAGVRTLLAFVAEAVERE